MNIMNHSAPHLLCFFGRKPPLFRDFTRPSNRVWMVIVVKYVQVAAELLSSLWQTQSHEGTIQLYWNMTYLNQAVLVCSQWRTSQRCGASGSRGLETSVKAWPCSSPRTHGPQQYSSRRAAMTEITGAKGRKMKGNADGEKNKKVRKRQQTKRETRSEREEQQETVRQRKRGVWERKPR